MKFNVCVGNVALVFRKQQEFDGFRQYMSSISSVVKLIETKDLIRVYNSSNTNYFRYIETRYTIDCNPTYYTKQIRDILDGLERTEMNDTTRLLSLISKQLIVISTKLDELGNKVDELEEQVYKDTSIDSLTDDIADQLGDKLEEKYIDRLQKILGIDNT